MNHFYTVLGWFWKECNHDFFSSKKANFGCYCHHCWHFELKIVVQPIFNIRNPFLKFCCDQARNEGMVIIAGLPQLGKTWKTWKTWKIQEKSENWGWNHVKTMKKPENLKKSGIKTWKPEKVRNFDFFNKRICGKNFCRPCNWTLNLLCTWKGQYSYHKNLKKSGILIAWSQEKS